MILGSVPNQSFKLFAGFVGAGGLGQRMDESLKMMAGNEVASILLVFIALVACADLLSKLLRREFAQ